MANREACELWVEQRSGDLAEEGKGYEEIGRIVSAEIAKMFQAVINARTIAQRARRSPKINPVTNVTTKSNDETNSVTYKSKETSTTHPPTERGGAREGAGRPKKESQEQGVEATQAWALATAAIDLLKNIKLDDPERDEQFSRVLNWILENKKRG